MNWVLFYSVGGWLICASMLPVVLRRQFAPGAAWAWLGIVFLHPYVGLSLYMLVGENQLSPGRTEAYRKIIRQSRGRPAGPDANSTAPAAPADGRLGEISEIYRPMARQAEKISGLPICQGDMPEFIGDAPQLIQRLCADIDAATRQVHLLYYIFSNDAPARQVADAVKRAAARGVKCRVLVDAVASRRLFHSDGLCAGLSSAGVQVAAALPVTSFKRGLSRMDMRNHRKLTVIDDSIAFIGSHNLIDPSYGGRRGNPWVDLTARMTGPVVSQLAGVFREDWSFETGETLPAAPPQSGGPVAMQVVPTGPTAPGDTYRRLLLGAIECARKNIVLSTPYFVPDETAMVALMMAADQGVNVKMILPRISDSILTAASGRAQFSRLMEAGIEIYLYRPGLLHAKTTTVDDELAMIGSANLDVRSFNLNFELSVLMYSSEATKRIRRIQAAYLNDSDRVDEAEWSRRPALRRYAGGMVSLISPLL